MDSLKNIFTFIDAHGSAIMAITTLVYTILTVILVIQNRRAVNQTKKQFDQIYAGRVFPSLVKIEGSLLCLQFENQSPSPVQGFKIHINEDWLNQYDNVSETGSHKFRESLEKANTGDFFTLMPKQKIAYVICSIPGGVFKELSHTRLNVTITYADKKGTQEKFSYDLKSMGSQLTTIDDYIRMEKKKIDELRKIDSSIKELHR